MINNKNKKICDIILENKSVYDEILKTKEELLNGEIVLYIDDLEDYDILEYLFKEELDRDEEYFFDALVNKPEYVNPPLDDDEIINLDSTDLLSDLGIKKCIIFGSESDDFIFKVDYSS